MNKVYSIFVVILLIGLSFAAYHLNSINQNLKNIEKNVDNMNIMLDEMTETAEKSNKILKEMTGKE